MAGYRLTYFAQSGVASILTWSHEQFGAEARVRYEALIVAAIRDAAASRSDVGGHTARPEMGAGVFSWHLSHSRDRSPGGVVNRPRHFLTFRYDGETLVTGSVLHDAMDLQRHVDPRWTWD